MKAIKVKEILGTEIRSRIPIVALQQQMDVKEECVIDMSGIIFISRSFADELYNLEQDYRNVSFVNLEDNVKKMMDVVWMGRKKKRVRSNESVTLYDLTKIEDFSKFLQTI